MTSQPTIVRTRSEERTTSVIAPAKRAIVAWKTPRRSSSARNHAE